MIAKRSTGTIDDEHAIQVLLLYHASQNDVAGIEKMLTNDGVNPSICDYDRRTAAHIAASEGHIDVLKLLHKYNADLNAEDRWHGTPLDDALMENRTDCIKFLSDLKVKHGIKKRVINTETVPDIGEGRAMSPSAPIGPILQHSAEGNLHVVRKLVNPDNINDSDYDQRTALHIAASENQFTIVKYLVEQGALINPRDRWGHTPLDDAVRGDFTELVAYLRGYGGETTGAYNEVLRDISDAQMKDLQEKGIKEKWALDLNEIHRHGGPFAQGSGGELYKARWRGLDVVVKSCENMVSNEQALNDLGNEIWLLSTMRHPNLVMFLGASFAKFPPILLMEYCVNGTLEERLIRMASEGKTISKTETQKYTLELALALNFVHLCNPPIVHRDLKPSNILLTEDFTVKVTDFGLSKYIPSKNKKMNDKFSMTGETGSYRFMAPEVFKHEQYNEKVDVYSYALIVYWMFTGCRPYQQYSDPIAAINAVALKGERPPLPKNTDPRFKKLVESAWAQDQEMRPSFAEIIETLDSLGFRNRKSKSNSNCCIS